MIKRLLTLCIFTLAAPVVLAEPLRFNFAYEEPGGAATATGYVVFESTQIVNPGRNTFDLPSPAVLDLSITIVNADAGNGTFGLADFERLWFDTNGGTLDFSRSLMGQPTDGLPWGTPPVDEQGEGGARGEGLASSGDFNLFVTNSDREPGSRYENRAPSGVPTQAPNGEWFYTLGTNGGPGNALVLVAFGPTLPHSAVPLNAVWALGGLMLVIAGVGMFATRRRPTSI